MATGTLFTNNCTQAVRLPIGTQFADHVKKVDVRVVGQERIVAPTDASWNSLFLSTNTVTNDFMRERASQSQVPRRAL